MTIILQMPVCTSVNNCTVSIHNVQGDCAALKVSSTDSTVMAVGRDIILYHSKTSREGCDSAYEQTSNHQ